jgi:hypothetical protein
MNFAEIGTRYSVSGGMAKCAVCEKELSRNEVKVVLPSSAFLASSMPMERRFSCANCYKALLIRTKAVRRRHSIFRRKQTQKMQMQKHTAGRSLSIVISGQHAY